MPFYAGPEEDHRDSGDNCRGYFRAWLGMQLQDGRYCIIRKLGWGDCSTVWLVQDFRLKRYAALKILTREATARIEPGKSDEVAMLEAIASADASHESGRHMLQYYESFGIQSSTGSHLCIVTEVLGPSVYDLNRQANYRLPLGLLKACLRQTLLGLDYLHTVCGIVHTDIKFDNLMLRLSDMPSRIVHEIVASPSRTQERYMGPTPSPYIVDSQPITMSLSSLDFRQVEVAIADFGQGSLLADRHEVEIRLTYASVAHWSHRRSEDDVQPVRYRAPEVVLGHPWGKAVDVWTIGCLTIQLLTGTLAFVIRFSAEDWPVDEDHLAQMTDLLGEQFPSDMLDKSRKRSKYFDQDGTFIHAAVPRQRSRQLRSYLTTGHLIVKSDEREIDGAYSFLKRCLRLRPEDRSSAKELAEDPWLVPN